MAEKKKKLKPFKTAAGAVQFMRNFDLDNMVDSSREEIDKMMDIFEREHKKLGPKKFKEKYAGKTLMQVEAGLDAMREAQLAEGYRKLKRGSEYDDMTEDTAKLYDRFEKKSLDFAKKLGKKRKSGNSRGGLTRTGHTDLRKTGLFR
jgi:predicted secreted protein